MATESEVKPNLSVEEMAELLGVSWLTVLRGEKDGTIPGWTFKRVGRAVHSQERRLPAGLTARIAQETEL